MRRRPAAFLGALLLVLAVAPAQGSEEASVHVHRAEPGDTLIGLSRRLLVDPARWPDLQRLNGVRHPRRIPIGTPIRIPLAWMRIEPAAAVVVAAGGGAVGNGAAVGAGQSLPEGSVVAAGAAGHATVQLVDGTVLRLRPGSELRIDTSHRVPAAGLVRSGARLDRGRIEVDANPARGGQPGFRIGTPQGVLGVRGTRFRVRVDEGGTRTEVLEGQVGATGVADAGTERSVAAGQGTVIDRAGRAAPPSPLLPAPVLRDWPALHDRIIVRLQIEPLAAAAGYRAQVARDEQFHELLADVQSSTPELRIAGLADGRWPMRVRAVDAAGLEGHDAVVVLQLKARPEPPLPRSPAPRAVLRGSSVDFAWTASTEASSYRLQIARRAEPTATAFAAPVLDLGPIEGNSRRVDGLAPGPYVWRLASLRAGPDQGPFGDAVEFELKALPSPPAAPAPPAVGDQSLRVHWAAQEGQRFDFQIARDIDFAQLVFDRQLDRPEVELPLPGDGRFFLRLRLREADGFVGPWTAVQHFDIVPCVRDAHDACVRVEGGALQLAR